MSGTHPNHERDWLRDLQDREREQRLTEQEDDQARMEQARYEHDEDLIAHYFTSS